MKYTVIYQKSTETIRQMPQNCLVAQKINNRWIVDPDNSADKQLCLIVFEITNSGYYRKYELSGDELIKEINSKIDQIKEDFLPY